MKKLIILIIICAGIQQGLSQSPVYPWNTEWDAVEDNAYIKDTQNQLLPYTGTWVYTNGNKKVTIKLQRIMYYYTSGKKHFMDKIAGRYKVENGSTVVFSDWDLNFASANLSGVRIYENKLYGSYFDAGNCRILSDVKIWLDPNNPNKMYMESELQGKMPFVQDEDECPQWRNPGFGENPTIPRSIVLYKQ